MAQPEQQAREEIDRLLTQAGWRVADLAEANIHASRGVALREFPLESGFGFADYLLYVDGKAAGVIEAKKAGTTLIGVESQSSRYGSGLPASLPAWRRPLPFLYESTGVETHFTNGLDPEPRARPTFAFHRPELLADCLRYDLSGTAGGVAEPPSTFLSRVRSLPPLIEDGL
jgi:type I restriction enzyme R subunit